jgi:hypothetical protein
MKKIFSVTGALLLAAVITSSAFAAISGSCYSGAMTQNMTSTSGSSMASGTTTSTGTMSGGQIGGQTGGRMK